MPVGVLKSLGLTPAQVVAVYLSRVGWPALAGCLTGVAAALRIRDADAAATIPPRRPRRWEGQVVDAHTVSMSAPSRARAAPSAASLRRWAHNDLRATGSSSSRTSA